MASTFWVILIHEQKVKFSWIYNSVIDFIPIIKWSIYTLCLRQWCYSVWSCNYVELQSWGSLFPSSSQEHLQNKFHTYIFFLFASLGINSAWWFCLKTLQASFLDITLQKNRQNKCIVHITLNHFPPQTNGLKCIISPTKHSPENFLNNLISSFTKYVGQS